MLAFEHLWVKQNRLFYKCNKSKLTGIFCASNTYLVLLKESDFTSYLDTTLESSFRELLPQKEL